MTKIYILGTEHSSKNSKKDVQEVLQKIKFKLILREGIRGNKWSGWWYKQPLLYPALIIYLFILEKRGTEFKLLKKLAIKKEIPLRNIDVSYKMTFNYFHSKWNYLLQILFLLVFWYIIPFTPIDLSSWKAILFFGKIIFTILLASILYFIFYVLVTKGFRDKVFIHNIKALSRKIDGPILVVCGQFHIKSILKSVGGIALNHKKSVWGKIIQIAKDLIRN